MRGFYKVVSASSDHVAALPEIERSAASPSVTKSRLSFSRS